jgi:AraC-like DNA-binding protein
MHYMHTHTRAQASGISKKFQLYDCGLPIAAAANRAAMSPRQIQWLFRETGSTFSEFVLEQHLLLAYRARYAAGQDQRDSARCFAELSYFHRSIRKRFSMTPVEWQRVRSSTSRLRPRGSKTPILLLETILPMPSQEMRMRPV